jgi:hypothetical protein
MDSATDCLRDELQRSLDATFSSAGCPYDKVAVLILYWLEDDFLSPCANEAQKVVDLFSRDFQYETEIFPIPSLNSQNLLEQRVVNFKCANDSESSLLIVYYSGHGDPDVDRGKAVWAAYVYVYIPFQGNLLLIQKLILNPGKQREGQH